MRVWPGQPYPLGSHYDGMGTNFSRMEPTLPRWLRRRGRQEFSFPYSTWLSLPANIHTVARESIVIT